VYTQVCAITLAITALRQISEGTGRECSRASNCSAGIPMKYQRPLLICGRLAPLRRPARDFIDAPGESSATRTEVGGMRPARRPCTSGRYFDQSGVSVIAALVLAVAKGLLQ